MFHTAIAAHAVPRLVRAYSRSFVAKKKVPASRLRDHAAFNCTNGKETPTDQARQVTGLCVPLVTLAPGITC